MDGECVRVRVWTRGRPDWKECLPGVTGRDSRRSGLRQAWQSWTTGKSGRCRSDGWSLVSFPNELEKRKI